ncbi:MAG: LON peptidase substrate-binding domain-containing protein [Candidatus Pacebacteria bacterium]|nr:LON peptidase substrate-binding domain-containing protein [Candidatus Paceibacterota bacterium]
MKSFFSVRFDELPPQLPIFPLAGALLLPHGRMPLTIFEPRYLQLIFDALATPERMMGMVLPHSPPNPPVGAAEASIHAEEAHLSDAVPIYPIGCAGRITSMTEGDDGRVLIILEGVIRFNIAEELPFTKAYRRVSASWSPYRADMIPELVVNQSTKIDRKKLTQALRKYFTLHGIDAEWEAIDHTPDNRLVNSLAMICPFEDVEKQALLESPTLLTRAELITNLLEMAVLSGDTSEAIKH